MSWVAEITHVEDVIDNEIEQGLTQTQIAQTYALALRSSWPTDWKRVNTAIINRWSASGLERVKKMAWSGKCFDRQPPEKANTARYGIIREGSARPRNK